MNIYQPYTYLIGWSDRNRWYYGSRYGINCHPDDLWKTYFTSSKKVLEERDLYGEPDVIQIRRIFETAENALAWETKVLRRMKVSLSESWINIRENQWPLQHITEESRTKISVANKSKIVSDETCRKISKAAIKRWSDPAFREHMSKINKGKTLSDEHRKKLSIARQSYKHTDETRQKISEANRKRTHTEESKRKIGDAHRNKVVSEETRAKLSKSSSERTHTEESKRKIGAAHRNKIVSEETRQRMRESQRKRRLRESNK